MKKKIKIENLDCANCASKLESALAKLDGVDKVRVNFLFQQITIESEDLDKIKPLVIDETKKKFPDVVVNW